MKYLSVSGTNWKTGNLDGKRLLKRAIKVSHCNLRLLILQVPLASVLGIVMCNIQELTHTQTELNTHSPWTADEVLRKPALMKEF